MFLKVKKAQYLGDYRIKVLFSDGREGEVDLSSALEGPVFEPLRDQERFRAFRVDEELGTIVWETGADLAPEYLYSLAFGKKESREWEGLKDAA